MKQKQPDNEICSDRILENSTRYWNMTREIFFLKNRADHEAVRLISGPFCFLIKLYMG